METLPTGDGVDEATVGGERGDEGLQLEKYDQDAVDGPRQRAHDDRDGQDQLARRVLDQRHIEYDHPNDADDGADKKIDAANRNGKRLTHGEDGRKRETRHEVLGVRGGGEAGRDHAESGDRRNKEQNERCGRGAGGHRTHMGQRRAARAHQRWDGWIAAPFLFLAMT